MGSREFRRTSDNAKTKTEPSKVEDGSQLLQDIASGKIKVPHIEHDVDTRFEPAVISRGVWHKTMFQKIINATKKQIADQLDEGYNYHGTSIRSLCEIKAAEMLELRPDADGDESISVVPGRAKMTTTGIYLARGISQASVPVILRIHHESLPQRVKDSYENFSGPNQSKYHFDIPVEHLEYFDFVEGKWRQVEDFTGELDDIYTLAEKKYQQRADKFIRKLGVEEAEQQIRRTNGTLYFKIKETFTELGLSEVVSSKLALAKQLEKTVETKS